MYRLHIAQKPGRIGRNRTVLPLIKPISSGLLNGIKFDQRITKIKGKNKVSKANSDGSDLAQPLNIS